MSDLTRRELLRGLALTVASAGAIDRVAAQTVHHLAAQSAATTGGAYRPKTLTAHQYRTLERLTDLIVPVENGAPGAVAAGAAAWIDMLLGVNDQLKASYVEGFAWLDATMKAPGAKDFVSAPNTQQTALLDLIAFRRNETPALAPGIRFFALVRRMTVDAFYTSEIGIRDIDYRGNTFVAAYTVPQEAIDYALKKSGL